MGCHPRRNAGAPRSMRSGVHGGTSLLLAWALVMAPIVATAQHLPAHAPVEAHDERPDRVHHDAALDRTAEPVSEPSQHDDANDVVHCFACLIGPWLAPRAHALGSRTRRSTGRRTVRRSARRHVHDASARSRAPPPRGQAA